MTTGHPFPSMGEDERAPPERTRGAAATPRPAVAACSAVEAIEVLESEEEEEGLPMATEDVSCMGYSSLSPPIAALQLWTSKRNFKISLGVKSGRERERDQWGVKN